MMEREMITMIVDTLLVFYYEKLRVEKEKILEKGVMRMMMMMIEVAK